MKKYVLLLSIIPLYLYSTRPFIYPFFPPSRNESLPEPTSSPKIVINAGPTLSKWHCPQRIILNVSSNKDFIKSNQNALVPGFSFSLKRKFWQSQRSNAIYIGAKVNFAKRANAIKTDYYNYGQPQAELEIHQDIKSIRVAPFAEWVIQQTLFSLSAWVAPTIGIRGVQRFRWWEKATKSYTGQSLAPYPDHAGGEFGTTLLFGSHEKRLFFIGYSFFMGQITFKQRLFITTPDPNASQEFHDQVLLEDANNIHLPVEPKIRVNAHVFRFGFAITF